jgi:hypothetical protein
MTNFFDLGLEVRLYMMEEYMGTLDIMNWDTALCVHKDDRREEQQSLYIGLKSRAFARHVFRSEAALKWILNNELDMSDGCRVDLTDVTWAAGYPSDDASKAAFFYLCNNEKLSLARLMIAAPAALRSFNIDSLMLDTSGVRAGRRGQPEICMTTLMRAVRSNEYEIASVLVNEAKAGVDVKDKGKGWTPLIAAINFGNMQMVSLLLTAGARTDICDDSKGWSALHWATSHGCLELVQVLLQYGADPALETADNFWVRPAGTPPIALFVTLVPESPISIATDNDDHEVLAALMAAQEEKPVVEVAPDSLRGVEFMLGNLMV